VRLGFTGTRSWPAEADAARATLHVQVVCSQTQADEFTTGAAVGFDALAANYLLDAFPGATHRLVVPSNWSQVDLSVVERFRWLEAVDPEHYVIELMSDHSTYEQRNRRVVACSDALCAVVGYPERHGKSLRSGSWQTIRIARAAQVPVHDLVLVPA
jgi:hypothetical protein